VRSMSGRRAPVGTAVVAAAAFSLLTAGCGNGGSSRSTTAAATPHNGALAFARCMRAHGVPNWPDPNSSGVFDKSKLAQLGVSRPRVRALEGGACGNLLTNGGAGRQQAAQQKRTRLIDALGFARCMRARGFSSFPDPTNQGLLTPEMVTAAGIDLHQPDLLKAGLACVPVTHGLLSRAAIERAVNGG
jgi:hypothetical protein